MHDNEKKLISREFGALALACGDGSLVRVACWLSLSVIVSTLTLMLMRAFVSNDESITMVMVMVQALGSVRLSLSGRADGDRSTIGDVCLISYVWLVSYPRYNMHAHI